MKRLVKQPALSGVDKLKSTVARRLLPAAMRASIRPLWGSALPVTWQRGITGALLHNGLVPRRAVFGERQLGGIRTEVITPRDGAGDRVLFFVHGGGYVVCSPRTHRPLTSRLGLALNATTYVPHYPLAPEQAFPAGLNAVLAAYQGLLATGVSPGRIVVAGDSAGGGMALALMLSVRDKGLPLPARLLLISPWTDLTNTSPTLHSHDARDPMLSLAWVLAKTPLYTGLTDAAHPLISPLFADLRGLPPTLVQVGSEEILLGDSERLAERAAEAGWDLTLTVWDGLFHDFQMMGDVLPEADIAIAEMAAFANV